jgi:hypothetical protein
VENFLTDDTLLHEDSFEKKEQNIGKIWQNLYKKKYSSVSVSYDKRRNAIRNALHAVIFRYKAAHDVQYDISASYIAKFVFPNLTSKLVMVHILSLFEWQIALLRLAFKNIRYKITFHGAMVPVTLILRFE